MLDRYEMPWRPNYEAYAFGGWTGAAALSLAASQLTPLPAFPILGMSCICAVMGARRAYQAWWQHRRKSRLTGKKLKFMKLAELQKRMVGRDDKIWFGDGFEWDQPHAQLAHEIMKRSKKDVLPKVQQMGQPWIHGLSEDEEALYIPIIDTKGHLLLVGTTGSGKTRFLDLLVSQAILRDEAVIIIDPKGDKELRENARRACVAMGHPEKFVWFHPGFPELSARIDPMKNFNRHTELASRVAALVPSETGNDPFKAYCQMALNNVTQGIILLGRQPNLIEIRSFLEGTLYDLVIRCVSIWSEKHSDTFKKDIHEFVKNTRDPEKLAKEHIKYYRTHIKPLYPNQDLEGLLSMNEHDRTHFGKMIASLLPVLNQLTSGHLGKLMSPDPQDMNDQRQLTDMAKIIQQGQVAYIGLDSLTDSIVGSSIGSIILADLAAHAGDRYNYSVNNRPVNVVVDEAAEVINDPLIQLLNKGRGAEFRLLLATQTFADFVARTGSEHKARQILGNINNTVALRVIDNETQEYITAGIPMTRVRYIMKTQGNTFGTGGHARMEFGGNAGERLMEEEAELFPSALLGQLPNLEFIARISGGRLVKGRVPILDN